MKYEYKYGDFSAMYAKAIIAEELVSTENFIGIRYDLLVTANLMCPTVHEFAKKFHEMRTALRKRNQRLLFRWSEDGETWSTLYDFVSNRDPGMFFVTKFLCGTACEYVWAISIFKRDGRDHAE